MIPLVSVEMMRDCDRRAVERHGVDTLVRRAGVAVAAQARQMLGTLYGRRIAVVVGPGLNGADGRVAARTLRARGSLVDVVTVAQQPHDFSHHDLVIDAAFGLGCRRDYVAPRVTPGTRVLAVDLPSGVDADTGRILGRPLAADVTLALGALKFAHVDGPATQYVGELRFADLGIEAPLDSALITDHDLAHYVRGHPDDHKWRHPVSVLAGSTLMPGAASLVCQGALCAGASMIRLESFGKVAKSLALPPEVVRVREAGIDPRSRSVVAGPGLGADAASWLRDRLKDLDTASVLDADALTPQLVTLAARAPRVLTPHIKEFERLGSEITPQRIAAVRSLAARTGSVVLLKGPITVISSEDGRLRIVNAGTPALATAGTGDVLAGMIGAALARGHEPLDAAALSAQLHARAGAALLPYQGASALAGAVGAVLSRFVGAQVHTA